ncbi:MAG: ABC transporter ATP-binding protein [Gammaproteobacteria bacterium]|nr:ABC transporter ATP-binding protein [Gammaproteobacteria bacterium]
MSLLDVKHLDVRFTTPDGVVQAVNDVSFSISRGEAVGLVGESGCGKTQLALSIVKLVAPNGSINGSISFQQRDLLSLNESALNTIRGRRIAFVFQDPMTALNPHLKISTQLTEVLTKHEGISRRDARKRALDMLDAVRIPDAANRMDCYPHEFSGGMRQRVMIAMALLCKPDIIIADEPTTALDVTVQAQLIALLQELRAEFQIAVLLITHDLSVVAGFCDRVLIMYAGSIVEAGFTDDIFYHARHPYTHGLLATAPKIDQRLDRLPAIPGQPPSLLFLPSGCPFHPRCEYRMDICSREKPLLSNCSSTHSKACHLEVLP